MSEIYDRSDRFVDSFAALGRVPATLEGLAGHGDEMTAFSPGGYEERNEHSRSTLRTLTAAAPESDRDRIAADVLREALETGIELYDTGEHLRELNVIASPVQAIRMCFDMMPTETESDWDVIAARMGLVPEGLESYQQSLSEGVRQGLVAARRQAVECTRQAETWSGVNGEARPFFLTLVDRYDEGGIDNQVLRDALVERATRAGEAYAALGRFRRVEAMIAPPGGAAAMYYSGPSEDFSRPGRTWYPTLGKTRFPLWGEVSICYHEGVPGHHLQIAQVRYLASELSRFQRTLAGWSGHAEGWALYAERLMGELGYLDDPAYELGMLRAQALRAMRVVVDIGLHLELSIPADERYHPGETWTPDLALPFVMERSGRMPEDFMRSEVDRYLGWPGQAISYKIGERVWLAAREAARQQSGDAFDLKTFHARALNLGPMGLGQLRRELAGT